MFVRGGALWDPAGSGHAIPAQEVFSWYSRSAIKKLEMEEMAISILPGATSLHASRAGGFGVLEAAVDYDYYTSESFTLSINGSFAVTLACWQDFLT